MLERIKIFLKAQFSAFTGGVCDYLIMLFLTECFGIHYTVSIAAGCILGAVINFSINKTWSFFRANVKYRFTLTQQLLRFVFVVTSSIALKIAGTYLLTQFTCFDYKIARIITDIVVSLCYNYVLQRYWVFRTGKRQGAKK
ncbi:MAG: GtrA family protein [Prevotellaceae bacterium]|jgi:putative flippase GtrA|nr:GtrA family protein [Prevotellaceae bacterium]